MFPGQGSQVVGMGNELYESNELVRHTYDEATELVNIPLKEIMFSGPEEELKFTSNAQPALLLASIAITNLLKNEGIHPSVTIGHSLGEYSALVASGVLQFKDALPLVHKRGLLMEKAYPKGQGSMAAVLGMEEVQIKDALVDLPSDEVVNLANFNCPGQIVISGTKSGVEKAKKLLKDKGARRVQILEVSGPFHSELMKPASEEFSTYLKEIKFNQPSTPIYMNVTAKEHDDIDEIKDLLVEQLYSPVLFNQSIEQIIQTEQIDAFVEVGNGRVLSGLLRKIDRSVPTFVVQDQKSLEKFLSWYKEEQ